MNKFYFILIGLFIYSSAFAQRELAITMDDPNTTQTPVFSWEERNNRILETLDKYNVKIALFVCGKRIDNKNGIKLLNKWDNKNHMICNHSYSHFYFNSKSKTSKIFINDFKKGDSLINKYKNYTRLFRFPYLKEGNTIEKRDSIRQGMKQMGYKNGHVTIDASDWYIDSKIIEELKRNPNVDLTVYKKYYIKHILERANYYDSLATALFKRKIKHTLLIHHSLLNALFLDDLLQALKNNGWKLIDAKEAYNDSIFNLQPMIIPCGESIVWQCAKLDAELSKTLRYPAEDSEYEKKPLEKAINEYNQNQLKSLSLSKEKK